MIEVGIRVHVSIRLGAQIHIRVDIRVCVDGQISSLSRLAAQAQQLDRGQQQR